MRAGKQRASKTQMASFFAEVGADCGMAMMMLGGDCTADL
jgi:hypothetical protein